MEYPKRFDFAASEPEIYKLWSDAGAFTADPDSARRPFVIVIPPPNITGALHMGHALNNTLQDILTRARRMQGDEALYLPGTDHAGIATQVKVEEALLKEGKTRFEMSREEFIERVWAWREKYGGTILNQLQRIGCSCDWTRTAFTLDPIYARAVYTVFFSLYEKGFIYRGKRLVNWCPSCKTALSDLESPQKEEAGHLWYVKYPLGDGRFAVMATTRPETILGDTAVACHPSDDRYKGLHGKEVTLPVLGRRIPVIADEYVDPAFGSGMVKITPAHDLNDFEIGERHNLEMIQVIDASGKMTEAAGPFAGLDRFECRKALVKRLDEEGLLEKVEDYTVPLSRCYRCSTVIEPYLSDQWFVSMKPLVGPAIEAVESGTIRFHPDRYKDGYLRWMEGIRDWCISRQLWWGHRIPIWYCRENHPTSGIDDPGTCGECGQGELKQDEDVLDTWFSSALWPFATLGWPDETAELEKFYPTSVLVTGRDIINLWVARMIVMGYEFCGDKPFSDIIINPIVQNIEGRRMSKSLGTGLDPLDLVDEYGADAIRFLMARRSTGVQDIRLGLPAELMKQHGLKKMQEDRSILEARNFVTKVWNACRFVLTSGEGTPELPPLDTIPQEHRWILSRLSTTIEQVTEALDRFDPGEASTVLYSFVWDEFCDYTIELSKAKLDVPAVRAVLLHCIRVILKLLHPFIPFVTEAIWQKLEKGLLIRAGWPAPVKAHKDSKLEASMARGIEVLLGIRRCRNQFSIPFSKTLTVMVIPRGSETGALQIAGVLGGAEIQADPKLKRPAASWSYVTRDFTLYIPLEGMVDLSKEIERQEKLLAETARQIERSEKKLSNEKYVKRAPAEVVNEERERLDAHKTRAREVRGLIADLKGGG